METEDLKLLVKFTRFLTLKVAQVVIQSRQGTKIPLSSVPEDDVANSELPTPQLHRKVVDWFNIAIPDVAEITAATKQVLNNLNAEIVAALSKTFVIEISLKTADGDDMMLELWTIEMKPDCDPNMNSVSIIYYRMGLILKSILTLTRTFPAYQMAKRQNKESYKICHRMCSGPLQPELLGEGYKTVNLSEIGLVFGTLKVSMLRRTMLTFSPASKDISAQHDIMLKSDHFTREYPKKECAEKKPVDLSVPLRAGAFVDAARLHALRRALAAQLPPPPDAPRALKPKKRSTSESVTISAGIEARAREREGSASSAPAAAPAPTPAPATAPTPAIEVPRARDQLGDAHKYSKMMEFPFADGSPMTELACFYQECLEARHASGAWAEGGVAEPLAEPLAKQLQMYEDAIPEFDDMLASMLSQSANEDSH